MQYQTKIIKELDEAFIKAWKELWEKSTYANYTNSPSWFLSVIETFGYKDFVIIAIYQEEKLSAIGALVKVKKYGLSCYVVPPGDFVSGTPFLLDITDEKVLNLFIKGLTGLQTVVLDNVSEEFTALLTKHTKKATFLFQALHYYLYLQKQDNGLAVIKKRNHLIRPIRNLEEKFSLRMFDGTTEEGINIIFAIDSQTRKATNGYGTFSDKTTQDFFRSLAQHFKKDIHFNILYFEDTPIAYEIGFIAHNTYFGNQIAYVAEYSEYTPGKVLLVHLLDWLVSNNIKKMDFGSGDTLLKRAMTKENNNFYYVYISQDRYVKKYLKTIHNARNTLYRQIHKHKNIYSIYKKIKNSL